VEKPFKADRLLMVVERALNRRAEARSEELKLKAGDEGELVDIPTPSPAARVIDKIAPTNTAC